MSNYGLDEATIHPWQDFLRARYVCIKWMTEKKCSDATIARILSIDGEDHVRSIKEAHRNEGK